MSFITRRALSTLIPPKVIASLQLLPWISANLNRSQVASPSVRLRKPLPLSINIRRTINELYGWATRTADQGEDS